MLFTFLEVGVRQLGLLVQLVCLCLILSFLCFHLLFNCDLSLAFRYLLLHVRIRHLQDLPWEDIVVVDVVDESQFVHADSILHRYLEQRVTLLYYVTVLVQVLQVIYSGLMSLM